MKHHSPSTHDLPFPQWITAQQVIKGVSDHELATAMGYEHTQVIAMFKTGRMRVPISKAPELAEALGVASGALMRRLLQDTDLEMLQAIEQSLGPLGLSEGEKKLIRAVRKVSPGKEPVPITFDRESIVTLVVA